MNQRGRKSAASFAVVETDLHGITRLGPPPGLSDAERGVWMGLVNSKPADYFGSEHGPMLVDYVRSICQSDVIAGQIKVFESEWFATDEGLKRYEKLIGMAAKLSGVMNTLARSMRLTHQAIYHKDKASLGPGNGRKLWQREPS